MSAPGNLVDQLKALGINEKTAKFALSVSADPCQSTLPSPSDSIVPLADAGQKHGNNVERAADYGEWRRKQRKTYGSKMRDLGSPSCRDTIQT